MPKFLVTNGSYYEPFTYNELAAPIMQAVEAHNAAQDAYDTIGAETAALKNYITDNLEDSQAKQMYDNYVARLEALQNNLWTNGYNASTRRDLATARAGYFSDITRLATIIKRRQDDSAAWSKMKLEHPELITSDNPAKAGLNAYLNDETYGKDIYTYNGKTFMEEVGADVQARGNELLRDPEVQRDPRMVGQIITKLREGFTNAEADKAQSYVRGVLASNDGSVPTSVLLSRALSDVNNHTAGLSTEEGLLAGALLSRLIATGAADRVNASEFGRLVGYGELGMRAGGIKEAKPTVLNDLQWKRDADWEDEQNKAKLGLWEYEEKKKIDQKYPTAKSGSGTGTGVSGDDTSGPGYVIPSFWVGIEGSNSGKDTKAFRESFQKVSDKHPLKLKIDGQELPPITDPKVAQDYLFHNKYWQQAKNEFGGLDILADMGEGAQNVTAYYTVPGQDSSKHNLVTMKLSREDADRLGLDRSLSKVALYDKDAAGKILGINDEATKHLHEILKNDDDYRKRVEKESGIKFSDYDNGPDDVAKIKKRWNIDDKENKLVEYYQDIANIKADRNLRMVSPAPLVSRVSNKDAMDRYVEQLRLAESANPGVSKKDSRFKLLKLNSSFMPTDTAVTLDQALLSNGKISNDNAQAIYALPELLEMDDGYLILNTASGAYAVPLRMFDNILTGALQNDRIVDYDGQPMNIGNVISTVRTLMEPFDHPETVYAQSDGESIGYARDLMYYLDPGYYDNNGTYGSMKALMSSERGRNGYYRSIVKLIEAAFAQPRETLTRMNFRVRGDVSDKTSPMFGN